jgi:hypothetical protein
MPIMKSNLQMGQRVEASAQGIGQLPRLSSGVRWAKSSAVPFDEISLELGALWTDVEPPQE